MRTHRLVAAGALALTLAPLGASAQSRWQGSAAAGFDAVAAPEVGGHGWALFDLRGNGVVGRGDLHVNFNTETLYVGIERLRVADRWEFNGAIRAEGAIAGVLTDWRQGAVMRTERGFYASYAQAFAAIKWHPADGHSLELVVGGRGWYFARTPNAQTLTLPTDTWVFEPRLRYTFWRLSAEGDEWRPSAIVPRVEGFAAGVELGLDLRADTAAWGALAGVDDGRNRPSAVIAMARQWARAGVALGARVRLQVDEFASWGDGEDDLTRVRVGGMNPYVVPVPGLPWAALLCERLVAAQASVNVRLPTAGAHEVGISIAGGAFNDVRRVADLLRFDGAAGAALFGDLRFGLVNVHLRAGWALPVGWLTRPNVTALVAVGVRLF